MNAIQRLKEEAKKIRIYQTSLTSWTDSAEGFLNGIAARHPDFPIQEYYQEIERQNGAGQRIRKIAVKHACVPGKADTRELEDYIGQKLPEDLARFYGNFMEAALFLRHPIHIYPPSSIVEYERLIRDIERGSDRAPRSSEVKVLRFVHIEVFAPMFALRKFEDGGWRVIVWGGLETTAELQDPATERGEFHVETFDEWLVRLLDTDGFPLSPFDPDFFDSPVAERIG
ncbi:MAG: hypothetical protein RLZZ476_1308 [Verrucomicrobiota bacterium]|jgi:hypothetical protein